MGFFIDFLVDLIYLIAQIWAKDDEIRSGSIFGESEFERSGRRFVAWLCGVVIVVLGIVLAGCYYWWWGRHQ